LSALEVYRCNALYKLTLLIDSWQLYMRDKEKGLIDQKNVASSL